MTVGFVSDERYFWHDARDESGGDFQAGVAMETPEARRRLLNLLEYTGVTKKLDRIEPTLLARADLERVHTPQFLDRFKALSDADGGSAGDYADFGPGSYEIASLAAGGVHAAIEAVILGKVDTAYALVRPPGHHAERDRGRGYCLLANTAVALERIREETGIRRVAIIDWDVHHGNGAQTIYWEDPDTLTISLHQHQLFPFESGRSDELGAGAGEGTNINVPLPAGTGIGAYEYAFDTIVTPAVDAFEPELIVIASGYDGSGLDPMGRMILSPKAFGELTTRALDLAQKWAGGRLVVVHEGGYSPIAVPFCGLAVVSELLGIETPADFGGFNYLDLLDDQALNSHQRSVIDSARDSARSAGAFA